MAQKFEINYTPKPKEYYDKLSTNNQKKIDKKLDMIRSNPYRFKRKTGPLNTLWAVNLTTDFRMLYSICKLCYGEGLQDRSFCRNYCVKTDSPYNVWVIALGTHKELRNFKYGGD